MNTDNKILKALDELRVDIRGLKQGQEGLEAGQKALEAGQQSLEAGQKALRADVQKQGDQLATLQDDVAAVKAETGKIPGLEQQLEHHGTLLTGLTATTATVLEEQHAQRSDIRSLHTEVHASREELKEEIRAARAEAKRDTIDLQATVLKKNQSLDRRVTNLEEHEGIENPEKH
jgi:chromosome segregation ATPase